MLGSIFCRLFYYPGILVNQVTDLILQWNVGKNQYWILLKSLFNISKLLLWFRTDVLFPFSILILVSVRGQALPVHNVQRGCRRVLFCFWKYHGNFSQCCTRSMYDPSPTSTTTQKMRRICLSKTVSHFTIKTCDKTLLDNIVRF